MEKKMIACDCGFTVSSSHGETELVEVAIDHAKQIHPDMKVTPGTGQRRDKASMISLDRS